MKEDNKFAATGAIVIMVALCIAIVISGMIMNKQTTEPVSDLTTEEVECSSISESESFSIEIRELISESSSYSETIRALIEPESTTAVTATEKLTERETEATEMEPAVEDEAYEYHNGQIPGDYIGHYTLTAYEWTGQPMADGQYPYYGAVACNSLPLGTWIYIEGYGTFQVCDRGGMASNVIDIYLGDEDTCWEFGVREADVYYA